MKVRFLPWAIALIFGLEACSGDKKPGTGVPPSGDSSAHRVDSTGQNPGPGDKGLTTVHPDHEPFDIKAHRIADSLFLPTCHAAKLDEVDKQPRFKKARETGFFRYQRKHPLGEGKVIPRWTFKSWKFATPADAQAATSEWLNSMEHSGDSLILGQNIQALKSPPLVCALAGPCLYMVTSSCLYKGKEWEALSTAFFEAMEVEKAEYRFDVSCEAGKTTYVK